MKYLLSILCLFVLSCDNGGDGNQSTCENIVGEWLLIDIDWDYSEAEECCDNDCGIEWAEEHQEEIDAETIVIFTPDIDSYCFDDDIITACFDEEPEECRDYEFSINGNILTIIYISTGPDFVNNDCYITMTNTYERID